MVFCCPWTALSRCNSSTQLSGGTSTANTSARSISNNTQGFITLFFFPPQLDGERTKGRCACLRNRTRVGTRRRASRELLLLVLCMILCGTTVVEHTTEEDRSRVVALRTGYSKYIYYIHTTVLVVCISFINLFHSFIVCFSHQTTAIIAAAVPPTSSEE